MSDNYCIGLDYGTNSVRAVIVNTANGEEIAESVCDYAHGEAGIIIDARDPNLARLRKSPTGAMLGLTLHSRPEEIYRAPVESTAFGARVIMERFEEYDQKVSEIVNCGGISVKNPMVMQTHADVMNRPLKIARSKQTPAIDAMTGTLEKQFTPISENARVYNRLCGLRRSKHDAFGVKGSQVSPSGVMKELIDIRDRARGQ